MYKATLTPNFGKYYKTTIVVDDEYGNSINIDLTKMKINQYIFENQEPSERELVNMGITLDEYRNLPDDEKIYSHYENAEIYKLAVAIVNYINNN